MRLEFKKPSVSVDINFNECSITSISFKGEEFIHKPVPLFKIKLRDHDASHFYVDAFEFKFLGLENGFYRYSNDKLEASLSVKSLENGLEFGIDVKNKTSLLLEQVELMTIGLFPKLLDEEGGRGEFDIVYNEGERITSMTRRNGASFQFRDVDYPSLSSYHMFPNMISSQFMTYICDEKGIYFGMHDEIRTPKHIDFHVVDDSLQTVMSVFTNCNYGEDYHMNFPSVLLFFEGNYFDGCEIYRKWLYDHKSEGLKTIKEKYDSLPSWYHESPVVLTYPVLGKSDSDKEMLPGGFYPYTNALPTVDYISKALDSKLMVILMQWESTAPWAPPYVWPPYGDIDNFYKYRDELHKRGDYLGVYTSGFGWTNVSYRGNYNKTEEFEKNNLKEIMCSNTDGFIKSTVVTDIRLGFDLCPACEKSKEIFINEANKMVNAGLDYVQILDQNHGGHPYFCYSEKHGHIPAPGKWQIDETKKILSSIDRKNCIFGCETAASEPYISELPFSDNRYLLVHHVGEAVPMYSYIYHEFVNNFMGNQVCCTLLNDRYSYTYRIAYSFICGDIFTLIVDGEGKLHLGWGNKTVIDEEMPLKLVKEANSWRKGKFAEFLHLGKMVKPLKYKCGIKPAVSYFYVYDFKLDAVLSSAYTNGVDTYQFFVNYDNVPEEIELEKEVEEIVVSSDGTTEKVNSNKIIVKPLSVIAIKI